MRIKMLQNWDENYDSISLSLSAPTFAPSWHMCVCMCIYGGQTGCLVLSNICVGIIWNEVLLLRREKSFTSRGGETKGISKTSYVHSRREQGVMGLNVYYHMILCTTAILNLSFSDSIPSKKKKKFLFLCPTKKMGVQYIFPPKEPPPNPQIISTFQQVYNQPTDQPTNRPPPPRCVEQKRFDGHQKKNQKKERKGARGGKGGQSIT